MSSVRIDRNFLKDFTRMAEQALESVAEAHGVKVAYKSGSFARSGENATLRFDLTAPDAHSGECLSREGQDFVRLCGRYGFEPDDLGKVFASRGVAYTITGLHPKRHKYPISAERNNDGKAFKFPASAVIIEKD